MCVGGGGGGGGGGGRAPEHYARALRCNTADQFKFASYGPVEGVWPSLMWMTTQW